MTWPLSLKTIILVVFSLLVKPEKCHAPDQHGRLLMDLSRANPELELDLILSRTGIALSVIVRPGWTEIQV